MSDFYKEIYGESRPMTKEEYERFNTALKERKQNMGDPIKMIYIFAEVDYKGKVNFSEGEIEEYSEYLFDGHIENHVRTGGGFGNYFDCQIYLPADSTEEFRDKIKNDIIQEFARRCFDKIKKYQDILEHLDDAYF